MSKGNFERIISYFACHRNHRIGKIVESKACLTVCKIVYGATLKHSPTRFDTDSTYRSIFDGIYQYPAH